MNEEDRFSIALSRMWETFYDDQNIRYDVRSGESQGRFQLACDRLR